MNSNFKRREHPEKEQQKQLFPRHMDSDEENVKMGDPLISPCKRLRLHDNTSGTSVTTLTDHTILQAADISCLVKWDHEVMYNTPEKTRCDGGSTFDHEEFVNTYNSTLEKSEQQTDLTEEEEASVMSSLGQPDLSGEQSHDRMMYWQSEPPRDEVLLSTPVRTLTFRTDRGEDGEDSISFISPQQTMPNNTPERSLILDGDDDEDSDGEIFINIMDQQTCPFPEVGTSITFVDRTNLDGLRHVETGKCPSEVSVTFADNMSAKGAHQISESLERGHEGKEQALPRPARLYSQPEPHLNNIYVPHQAQLVQDGLSSYLSFQQRHRFASVGNLCAEELDHHRLSLQSYGSVAHFQRQQPAFVRSASYRALAPHFQPVSRSLANEKRLVDYGSIDGPRGLSHGGDLNPRTVVDYGSVEGPVPYRLVADRQIHDDSEGRLWFYGSVDNPQRLAHSLQPVGQKAQHSAPAHGSSHQQGHAPSQPSDQHFVQSASRTTLPRLSRDRNQGAWGHSEAGHHFTGHYEATAAATELRASSRPWLGHIQESSDVSAQYGIHCGTVNKGTLCVMPGQQDSVGRYGGGPCSLDTRDSDPTQQHIQQVPVSSRASCSSGSHAEVQSRSQGSSGRPESLPRSDRSSDHHQHSSGTGTHSGSRTSQKGRSVGSQDSHERLGGGESRGKGFSAADVARVEESKKRRILETPGQVRIAIYLNCGLVTVHVIEGRNFTCNWKAACDSYIKLSLIPEEFGRKLRLKSKPVPNTNNPFFDEKFSLELQKSDEDKRLLISIWHKDLQSGCSEFMGCTSFGVKGIRSHKEVKGWYYMLREDVGKQKHLQVATDPQPPSRPVVRPRRANSIPQINSDVCGLDSVTIHIERGKNGFGFGLAGEFPVHVGRVDLASPAEEAGLKVGDFVIKVNNLNVSRSTVMSVARLIKKSGQTLVLVVNRPYSSIARPLPALLAPQLQPPVTAPADTAFSLLRRPDHIYESIADGTVPERSEFGDDCDKENEVMTQTQFEISSVSHPFTQDRVSASTPLVPSAATRKLSGDEGKKLESIHRLLSLELDFIDFMKLGIQRYARPLKHRIFTAVQHSAVFQNIETLVNISEYHVQQIQENAPSLYPESDDDSQSSDDRQFASAVAMIYSSKAHMFCKAHEAYASGLSEANRVLSEMRQNEEFQHFIKDPPLQPGQPSISAFIFRPLQHIRELWSVFQEIYVHTPSNSVDHATLKQVTQVLQVSMVSISNMSNARVQSVTSLSSHTKSSCSSRTSSASSAASSKVDSSSSESGQCGVTSKDAVRTMDRGVLSMQDRLVFSQNVPVFQLCDEDRRIIYQGDVFFMHNNHWSKIQMTLLSDMMVLCHPEADGSLHVLCDPLYLRDIAHIHTSSKHATELVLTLCPATPCTVQSCTQRLLLRTPSPQDLSTWCNLLGQYCHKASHQQQTKQQTQQQKQSQLQKKQQQQQQAPQQQQQKHHSHDCNGVKGDAAAGELPPSPCDSSLQ